MGYGRGERAGEEGEWDVCTVRGDREKKEKGSQKGRGRITTWDPGLKGIAVAV